jgi:riboflavin kinase/FMN adenylyltransferase
MAGRTVITIGNYDGVHRGHRAIIDRARVEAGRAGARVLVMTFEPHPARLLRPQSEPPRLMSLEGRVAMLRQAGADEVVLLEPTPALLAMSPRQWIEQVVARHHPVAIVEGPDFRFGHRRAGDVDTLRDLGREFAYETRVVSPVEVPLTNQQVVTVSSSLVRWLLVRGRVADATVCLGRLYALEATVVRGEQRGRTIDVPTANLHLDELRGRLVPGEGVYAGVARTADDAHHPAAISIGVKPTFGQPRPTVEAHLLDFDADLYDQPLELCFSRWLREQRPYPSIRELAAQLRRDINETRRLTDRGLLDPAWSLPTPERAAAHE